MIPEQHAGTPRVEHRHGQWPECADDRFGHRITKKGVLRGSAGVPRGGVYRMNAQPQNGSCVGRGVDPPNWDQGPA